MGLTNLEEALDEARERLYASRDQATRPSQVRSNPTSPAQELGEGGGDDGKRIANAFTIAAEWERRLRSERTREALARTRADGKPLGTPRRAPPPTVGKIKRLRAQDKSLQAIADELNQLRIPTARGGAKWRPSSVASVLSRVS
jgi:DNA invertase Pin-like site-specific DNA recombinase